MKETVITTQKTSKRYKTAGCLGGFVFAFACLFGFAGIVAYSTDGKWMTAPTGIAVALFVIAIGLRVYARIGKWWNND